MNRRGRVLLSLGASALIVGVAACERRGSDWIVPSPPAEGKGTPVHISGVVRRYEVEGGFFAIRGADSITYNPTNLPAELQRDGQAVEADALRRDDVLSIQQIGPVVDLVKIRAR